MRMRGAAVWHRHTNGHSGPAAWARTLAAGAGGALALNAVHEATRRVRPDAPRMDVIGMRALARLLAAARLPRPRPRGLRRWTLAGDLLANSAFYALLLGTRPAHPWLRAAAGGALAGAAGALLPPRIGLGRSPGERRPTTPAMIVGFYLAGGLAAAACLRVIARGARRG